MHLCGGRQRQLRVGGRRVPSLVPDAPVGPGACHAVLPVWRACLPCPAVCEAGWLAVERSRVPPPPPPPSELSPPTLQARAMGIYAAHCMAGVQDQAREWLCAGLNGGRAGLGSAFCTCRPAALHSACPPVPFAASLLRPPPRPLAQTGSDMAFELFTHVTRFLGHKVVLLGLYNGQRLEEAPPGDVVTYSRVQDEARRARRWLHAACSSLADCAAAQPACAPDLSAVPPLLLLRRTPPASAPLCACCCCGGACRAPCSSGTRVRRRRRRAGSLQRRRAEASQRGCPRRHKCTHGMHGMVRCCPAHAPPPTPARLPIFLSSHIHTRPALPPQTWTRRWRT